jgi:type I restriction-modification system DNA methylase subunit
LLPATLDEAFDVVRDLAESFETHHAAYGSAGYSEAQARQDFIDKFLTALGWDVAHNYQKNPFEQEVHVERNVDVGLSQKRADYAFFVTPNFRDVRFYVEAKKPSATLETSNNYFQVIRYGWNSHTPIAFLTDFESVHVLDCRYRPDIRTAHEHCVMRFHYTEYRDSEKFANLYYLLSREAVTSGALEKFSESLPKRRGAAVQRGLFKGGYQSIDDAFLGELDLRREELARSLKNRNAQLDGETLTEITQRILDRLVFLRFLEDKLIETDDGVANFGKTGSVWGDFQAASRRLDQKYNGIVYKHHPLLDTNRLTIDESVFGNICEDLSDVNTPYNFNLIPIHILGSIYERFLGKVIVATDKRARVEEKPEVRKAGGVYYTPEYIVRYIIENTVGKLIFKKTPSEIATLRFADISCGSGSFLLGVFDSLLAHHRNWYNANPRKIRKGECYIDENGVYRLTLAKRREILLQNIYGVDLDPQAVEVAQLSLYLKLLEEETTSSSAGFQREFHEALLPALNQNIVCGNSLIEPSMLQPGLFEDDAERRINPMNLRAAFPAVFAAGGFDAVVGNPPYVNAWELFANQPELRDLINSLEVYATADRHWDLYVLFIERAIQHVKPNGYVSYIVPFSMSIQKYAQKSRERLLDESTIESIADLRTVRVFGKVPVITIIPTIRKRPPRKNTQVEVRRPVFGDGGQVLSISAHHDVAQVALRRQHESMFRLDLDQTALDFIDAVEAMSLPFGDICYVNYGAQMSSRVRAGFGKSAVIRANRDSDTCKPLVSGRELYRYLVKWERRYVEYALAPKMYGPRWPEFFEKPKLMIRDITGTRRIEATLDAEGYYCDHTILCAQRNVDLAAWRKFEPQAIALSERYDLSFLAAVVLSKIVSTYYYLVLTGEGVRTGGGFHTYPATIRQFPVPKLTNSAADKLFHDSLARLADRALESKRKQFEAETERDATFHERRAAAAESEIDAILYEHYDLSAAMIARIEQIAR